jgi:FtsH-binding integral membrane protein
MKREGTMTDTQQAQQQTAQISATSQWLRLARITALTMAAWSIALQAFAGVFIPPVLVLGLVFLVFSFFLRGERRRLGLAYAIVTAIAFLGNVPVIVDDLVHIDSAPTFVLTLVSLLAAAMAVVAGLGAFFGWSATPIRGVAVAAVVVLVLGSVVSIAASTNATNDVAAGSDVSVVAQRIEFSPDTLVMDEAAEGVWIDNRDGIYHTFTIEALGIDVEIPAFKSRRIDLNAAPGTYSYVCTIPGHETMTGALIIEG